MHTIIPLVPLGTVFLILYIVFDLVKRRTSNIVQRVITYSFIFYVLKIFDLTTDGIVIPPLSDEAGVNIQLVPFYFLADWIGIYKLNGTDWFFWNSIKLTFFNFIMLAPLGVYAALLFRVSNIKKAALLVFLTSLIIEIYQLIFSSVGLIWPRGFNVDDLIINTLGGVVGFTVWRKLEKILKKK